MGKHINKPPQGPDDGKTGYRKPPREHQWPKGKSGNPKGRPPGSKGIRTDLKKVLATARSVSRDGKVVSGTTQFLMLEAMGLRASLGDTKAFVALVPYIIQAFGFEDRDVDENALSAGDEAILNRLLGRLGQEAAEPKRKPRRRRRKNAAPAKERSTADNGASSPTARKPRSRRPRGTASKGPSNE